MKKNSVYYVDDTELLYHIILSKGKGYATKRLESMLILIADNFSRKFKYFDYTDTIGQDCYQAGIEGMLNNWHKFDEKKYKLALPYITELYKRAAAFGFNEITKYDKDIISIHKWEHTI